MKVVFYVTDESLSSVGVKLYYNLMAHYVSDSAFYQRYFDYK